MLELATTKMILISDLLNIRRASKLAAVLFLSLTACQSATVVPSPGITAATQSTIEQALTITPVQSPVVTRLSATAQPAATKTAPSPTFPPVPTLGSEQAQVRILDLLSSNGGCNLPCWWGFVPGQSTWQSIRSFYASIGKTLEKYHSDGGSYVVNTDILDHDTQSSQVYFPDHDIVDLIVVRAATLRDNSIVYADPQFVQDFKQYLLPQLLNSHGVPTQSLLETFAEAPGGPPFPFRLLVIYWQQGILVEYEGRNEIIGEDIQICPLQSTIDMWLWPPEREYKWSDIVRFAVGDLVPGATSGYRPLEETTGMSLEQFHEVFSKADVSTCFTTPVAFWSP